MATAPAFAATPKAAAAVLATADTSRTAPTTVVTLWTAGASGSRIDSVNIIATGTTTAGAVRLFIYDGTNYRLFQEILVTAITPSTTLAPFQATLSYSTLLLQSGYSLRATTNNTEGFSVVAFGGDF
jgi:hypothetical protein